VKLDDVDKLTELVKERGLALQQLNAFEQMRKLGVKDVIIGFDNPMFIRTESFYVPFSGAIMLAIQKGLQDKIVSLETEMIELGVEL
jgi:hypothetical protein